MKDRKTALEDALRAAVKAKNPWMAASIRAAMRGEEFDPFEGLQHPEIKFLFSQDDILNPPQDSDKNL